MRREKWCPQYRVLAGALPFWRISLRTPQQMRPQAAPHTQGTYHNTLDSIGDHAPTILGHHYSEIACSAQYKPGTGGHKDFATHHFTDSAHTTTSAQSTPMVQHLMHIELQYEVPLHSIKKCEMKMGNTMALHPESVPRNLLTRKFIDLKEPWILFHWQPIICNCVFCNHTEVPHNKSFRAAKCITQHQTILEDVYCRAY